MSQVKRAFVFQLAGLVVVTGLLLWLAQYFDLQRLVETVQREVGGMELWGAVLYPFLLSVCNLLLLPGGILTVGSGLFFGLWWGFVLVLLGNVIGAALAFQISRRLGRGWIERKMMRDRKWVVLDEAIAREGWKIIVLSQVHPLFPTSLLNYLYGATRIRFWPCLLWIAVGQAPGLFLYVYLGTLAQHGLKLIRGVSHPRPVEYVIWLGGLLVTLAVTIALGRLAMKLMAEVERAALEPSPDAVLSPTKKAPIQPAALTAH